jgi:hypothetical protein
MHLEPLRAFLFQVGAYLPRLLFAGLVLLAGWLLAKAVRFTVIRGLRAINFHVLTERSGIDNFLRQGGMVSDSTVVFGALAYWLVILISLVIAFNGLGLSYVTDLLGRVMWFVPNVFVALLVVVFGAYFAKFVGDAVITYGRNAGVQDALLLGKIAQYAILLFVVLIALDQIKVGGDIVRQSFLIILAGIVFALALAFGLAGKDWAARRIEEWWPGDRTRRTALRDTAAPPSGMHDQPPPVARPNVAAWPPRTDRDRPHP